MKQNSVNDSHRLSTIFSDLLCLAYPDLCLVCGVSLNRDESHICHNCLYMLPAINHKSFTENAAAERFYGKIPFIKATAGFHYQKESNMQLILESLKYKGEKKLGETLGTYAGSKLLRQGFFNEIDLMVPVPLHRKKQKQRGYNQSEWIVRGLSRVSNIPFDCHSLIRIVDNKSQTTKSIRDRWENVASVFSLENPVSFENKHILLVDDVLTSGSTLEACGQAVIKAAGAEVSFFALAMA